MHRQVFLTADGSHSIALPAMNVIYHSKHGAIAESMHVFINAGLNYVARNTKNVSVFEVGFGTGLNALLTMVESDKKQLNTNYVAIEKFPLEENVFTCLNYVEMLGDEKYREAFLTMHTGSCDASVRLSANFNFKKVRGDVNEVEIPEIFDVIYFDAFDPGFQPEMWNAEVLEKMYRHLKYGGVLVTYCSKGSVQRILEKVGFEVEKLPGPKGKREIIRCHRN
jgi:tRNA U34 5-methylaminomethyl-2-thiouridine-forming methyltransferase MnmC